jgi:hypothetical protein
LSLVAASKKPLEIPIRSFEVLSRDHCGIKVPISIDIVRVVGLRLLIITPRKRGARLRIFNQDRMNAVVSSSAKIWRMNIDRDSIEIEELFRFLGLLLFVDVIRMEHLTDVARI